MYLEQGGIFLKNAEIVSYTSEYQSQITNLIISIQRDEFGIDITLEEQPDLFDIENIYQINDGAFFVALVEGVVIGTFALIDLGNGNGTLRKFFVDSKFRGCASDASKLLWDKMLAWGKEKKYTSFFLGTTNKFKAAHRFYEKNHFIEINKSDLPTNFPVMVVDEKFYKYMF
jgi:Acetyltransferase (GNAT) family.